MDNLTPIFIALTGAAERPFCVRGHVREGGANGPVVRLHHDVYVPFAAVRMICTAVECCVQPSA